MGVGQDLDTVVTNLGNTNVGGKTGGDLDGNGVVDETDLIESLLSQGAVSYTPTNVEPPTDFECNPLDGCKSYTTQDENGEWMCVSWMNCHVWHLGETEVDGIIQYSLQEPLLEDVPMVASFLGAPQWKIDCMARVNTCFQNISPYGNSPMRTAVEMFNNRCTNLELNDIIFSLVQCGSSTVPFTAPIRDDNGLRTVLIQLCCDATDLCTALAHELIHASQLCDQGLDDPSIPDDELNPISENEWNRMCMELEAYRLSGDCDITDDEGNPVYDHYNCCLLACTSADSHWTLCDYDCEECCNNMGPDCCDEWQFICDPEDWCPVAVEF